MQVFQLVQPDYPALASGVTRSTLVAEGVTFDSGETLVHYMRPEPFTSFTVRFSTFEVAAETITTSGRTIRPAARIEWDSIFPS